ncbi:CAAX amino terminal protease family [Verrucomicrobiia bacterium DG1235]|nr:CAAX amino terminal protease family [Verrucomicrobiae bacterium DG1235]
MLSESLDNTPSQAPAPKLAKWEISGSDFGIFVALLFSCMVVASAIFGNLAEWIIKPDPEADRPMLISLAENLGMQFGMLAAFLAFLKITYHQDFTLVSPNRAPITKAISIGLKWLLIAYPIMIGVNLLSRTILNAQGFEQVIQDPIRMVQEGGTRLEQGVIYAMIVLVAPICEEFVFRGAIFRYLHHRLPLYGAIALSAALFALLHSNLYSFAPLMVIGCTLALAYRESGSLVSAISFHAAFNTINLLLILLFPELQ